MSGLTAALLWLQIAGAPGLGLDDYLPFDTASMERCEALAQLAHSADADDPARSDHHARAGHCFRFVVPRQMPCRNGTAGAATAAALETIDRAHFHLSQSEFALDQAFAQQMPARRRDIANQCALRPYSKDRSVRGRDSYYD